jgi:predicted O-methyltransferase YrrM
MLDWKSDDEFTVGETRFRALPPDVLGGGADLREGEYFVFKPRPMVERHAALLEELRPKHIVELGFFKGGSTVFFAAAARPERLAVLDLAPVQEGMDAVRAFAEANGLEDVVRTYPEVDQADRDRLAELVADAFGEESLDLVVDDCSHFYEPTRASFNELFPRLRPGGVYVIEDWRWAHTPLGSDVPEGFYPDRVPMTRLLFELILGMPGIPDLITEITIEPDMAIVTRGEAEIDPGSFEIANASNPRGRTLLAPDSDPSQTG